MAPSGCSSMSIEVSYSENKPIDFKTIHQRVISDLVRVGLLDYKDDINFKVGFILKYAYAIPDSNYSVSRRIIIDYLTDNGILPAGRYGAWQYSTMEDAILDGKRIASKIAQKSK